MHLLNISVQYFKINVMVQLFCFYYYYLLTVYQVKEIAFFYPVYSKQLNIYIINKCHLCVLSIQLIYS